MSTAVLDTNVLASGFVQHQPTSPPVAVVNAWRAGLYTLVVSEHILTELARTFEDPYFRQRLSPTEIEANLVLLRRQAIITPITATVHNVATHPEDDLVLAAAISANADYLVTGDTRLQQLGSYDCVAILSPREFLGRLTTQRSDLPSL